MNTVTCGAGQISKPIGQLSIGDLVTLTGSGFIQYTESKSTAIADGTATWTNATLTNNTFRVMSNGGSVRLQCTSGTCTMTVDDGTIQDALQTLYRWDFTGIYAGIGGSIPNRAKRAIRSLDDAHGPLNILVMGDSTGNDTTEFPYRLMQAISAKYPAHTVTHRLWNDTNQQHDPATVLSVGAAGYRWFSHLSGVSPGSFISIPASTATNLNGDLDIRCKVNLGSPATATGTLAGKFGAAGQKSWRFEIDTGQLMFGHTADGTTEITRYSGTALSTAQKAADIWLRVTLDIDNGASGNTAKFYTSDDGMTWTQLGATSTLATVTSVFGTGSTTATQFCGRGGNASSIAADVKFYEFQVFGSLDETAKAIHFDAGCLPTMTVAGPTWSFLDDCGNPATYLPTAGANMGGSPRCAMFNASTGGQVISYSVDAARYDKQVGCTPALAFINYGHNQGSDITYRADYKSLTDKLLVTNPDICITGITQNTRLAVAGGVYEHAIRMRQVAEFCVSQGFDLIDTYKNWPVAYTRTDDGTHPTATGQEYWAQKVINHTLYGVD